MKPGGQRQRRKILSEEEYTQTLSQIIQRDYYPDLSDLERQAALQDRRSVGDIEGAVAIRRATRKLQRHEESLAIQEAEQEAETDERTGLRTVARPLHQETLSGFHTRATNEDDAEFEVEQRREIDKLHARKRMLTITNGPTPDSNHRSLADSSPFQLASDEFNPSPVRVTHRLAEEENSFFFVPTPMQSHCQKTQPQLAGITFSKERPNAPYTAATEEHTRALMPPPKRPTSNASIPSKDTLMEYIPKNRLEKQIEPSATRLPKQPLLIHLPRQHLEGSSSGSITEYTTDASTDIDSPAYPSLETDLLKGMKRRRREQASFVQMTPLIVPGAVGMNDSPITTWGTVANTPTLLETTKLPQAFQFPKVSERDEAASKARAKLDERVRKSLAASTPLLSKTALALLKRPSRPMSARSRSALGSALRISYTPLQQKRSGRDTTYHITPRTKSNLVSDKTNKKDQKSITDGLLKLPK